LFGYSESEAIGRPADELVPPAQSAEEREIIARLARGDQQPGEIALETIRFCSDGHPVHVSQTISPIRDARGSYAGISVIAHDITARKRLEREVLESSSREQQRIGRELHDSLGQELTGVSYLAKSLSQKLSAAASPLAETAATIAAGIQRALREVRSAVQGLVPVEVDASGFMVALEKLATDTGSRCGIDCKVESAIPVQIDDNLLATHLYRIVQEAINNAVKHAQAHRIVVRPESHNGTLAVTVEDDGVGMTDQAGGNGGMGLRIMRYRAGVIDATLDVQSAPGRGTAVVCLVKRKTQHVPT
jgi:two-component system, LuxR family, sensor kinase FixL